MGPSGQPTDGGTPSRSLPTLIPTAATEVRTGAISADGLDGTVSGQGVLDLSTVRGLVGHLRILP